MWLSIQLKALRSCFVMGAFWTFLVAGGQTVENPSGDGSRAIVATFIVLQVDELAEPAVADKLVAALRAMKGTIRVTADVDSKLLGVLAEAEGPVTVDRLIQYLGLAGYPATEATEDQYRRQEEELSGLVLEVPPGGASIPAQTEDSVNSGSQLGNPVAVVSLADSLEPLRLRFNGAKDKYRFVALLSPT